MVLQRVRYDLETEKQQKATQNEQSESYYKLWTLVNDNVLILAYEL